MEFTVIGDVVNVAQRLEEMTRKHDTDVIVSARLLKAATPRGSDFQRWQMLPDIKLRGRGKLLKAFLLPRSSFQTSHRQAS